MDDPALRPLKPSDAKRLARDIVENGFVEVSAHAIEEMANDDLETTDCLNLVRAGAYSEPEYIRNEWRYQIHTARICVVVTFASSTRLILVTAWRKK